MTKAECHEQICTSLTSLYVRKNHDYGDSFGKSFAEYGMPMPCIRLEDKLNRLKSLTRKDIAVVDESIDDTLMDLANYAIMTLIERKLAPKEVTRTITFWFPPIEACAKCDRFNKALGPHNAACTKCENYEALQKAPKEEVPY